MPRIESFIKPEEVLNRLELREGMKAADLGCGAGFFVFPAAKIVGDKGLVYAVDVQKSALSAVEDKAALEGVENIVRLVWANLEIAGSTKIPNDSLDLALLIDVLFQNQKPEEIIKEAKRITKNTGKIVIIDWKLKELPFGPLPDQRISEQKVKKMAAALGLNLAESWDPSPYHYCLVYRQ